MSTRDPETLKTLEAKYRGLAIEAGLREAAEALAAQTGVPLKPLRSRKGSSQYPFERALAAYFGGMEARYASLLDGAPDAVLATDQGGNVIFVNRQASKQFGYEQGDLAGKKLSLLIEGDVIEQIAVEGAEAAIEANASYALAGIELIGARGDGSRFPIEATFSLVRAEEDVALVVAIRDVSARKAAERRLVGEEARYRTVFHQAPAALILANRRGRIVQANVLAEQTMGYGPGELTGQLATTVLPQDLVAQMLAAIERGDSDVGASGAPSRYEGRQKGGEELAFEATISAIKSDQAWLAVASLRKIGTLGPAATNGNELRLQILEAVPDAVLVVNRRGDVVLMNAEAERRFGYSHDELIGQAVTRILPEGFLERLGVDPLPSTEAALAREIGAGIELVGERKDGVRFPLEIMLAALDADGEALMIATLRQASVRHATARRVTTSGGIGPQSVIGGDGRQPASQLVPPSNDPNWGKA